MTTTIPTIVEPFPPDNSTCGYCHSTSWSSFQAASLHAYRMSCSVYQMMIDRGWRRSGSYCYKPDLKRSCCPQYTIKLDATEFKASKSQRKLVNRWTRFVLGGDNSKGSSKGPHFVLEDAIHASESSSKSANKPAHTFEVTLEPSSYTDEKFALYRSYEEHIHKKPEKTSSGFRRFLVTTPLQREPIPYPSAPPAHLPPHYGSYHQLYRLDGRLVAMGVIDILPSCVSSVYFMWEKEYERFSLGKLSALREISLAKELHDAGIAQLKHLYMGYYIHTCQKMKYKGEYSPSFLADPEDFTWHPLSACQKALDGLRYACFTHPENSLEGQPPIFEIGTCFCSFCNCV
ncbi:arginine-tRNA-protein transferase [Multifurca ochricompacta]|uniref:arginyltransferase n=1 Tax=Multifurca ochricompacta TaxID=376703 RepID=A0AAD4MB96_9AGAM|nr:arginine-tRNA-protein transferase [Multifurca ochricompacta]